ncbi:MAG: acyl-ACP thioesterase [Pseudomonadales bacterium]
MTPCFWGSVNQWECDENDHLNVRYYAHKVQQAVQIFLARPGHPAQGLADRVAAMHIRFLAEARSATPLRVDCGVVDGDGTLLALVHQNISGDVLAAFVLTLQRAEPTLPPEQALVAVPDFAEPRGIVPDAMPLPPDGLTAALQAGYQIVGRGVIGADECDASDHVLPHGYIGRISDGMPNLWAFMNADAERAARATGALGGAALEQRLVMHRPLMRGSIYTQLSGVRSLGNKTQHMSHLIYDHVRDAFAASADAVGVAMDLSTRRAVPISAERRARLEPLLLR